MVKAKQSQHNFFNEVDLNSLNSYREDYQEEKGNQLPINGFLKHNPREYQINSLLNYILVNNFTDYPGRYSVTKNFSNNHHLFHCATGSGKTLLMAYLIGFLTTYGYKKVLFLTNSINLITKTKFNLLPSLDSKKCEFKYNSDYSLNIENKKFFINQVTNFSDDNDDIEICFQSIQDLHKKIEMPKENGLSLDDLKNHKILILGDEAHHFNSKTKGDEKDLKTWEDTIKILLELNNENKLIEFTATMELSLEKVALKYFRSNNSDSRTKIIFDFSLSKFRLDGYSKEILLNQSSSLEERVLLGLKSSLDKQKIALENKISLIPRIFFKNSGKIEDLKLKITKVFEIIKNIDLYDKNNLFSKKDIVDLHNLYNESSYISIHSSERDLEKDIKFRILNELDNNPNVRMVFAIDMLNEGWDVLSLFDIVKIDDVSADTTKEAQLIGRGARIFPFNYLNHDKFKRKFDNDLGNPLRKLETLNFFTANDSSYINKIKNELNSMGFNIQNNPITQIKVRIDKKEKFGNYYVFNNEVLNFNKIDIFKLKEISINESFKSSISSVDDLNIKNLLEKTNPSQIFEQYIHVFQWCLNKTTIDLMPIKFYTKLNSYDLLSNIFNQNNFIINTDKEWETLTWLEMTQCIQPLVDKSLKNLLKNINSKIGSKNLQGKKILDLFVDYMTTTDKVKNINNPIYYYEKLTLDSPLEEELHNTVFKNLNSENYVVIRNEGKLKFYSTEIDNSGDGFEPDFIVLKIDPNQHNHYHLFYLEVKGDGFIHKDKWKQDLLLNLVDNKLIDINNEFYHLHGFEFFSENNKNQWINTYFSQF